MGFDYSRTRQYQEGKIAYKPCDKIKEADCPYDIGTVSRTKWFCGWLDARTEHRLAHIIEKYGAFK